MASRRGAVLKETELEMPQSLEHSGQADFEEVFVDELLMESGKLPLSDFTTEGGWPDDDTLDVTVESVERKGDCVVINVSQEFDELVPTGCADVKRSESAYGKIQVVLDLEEKRAYALHEVDFDY
jgi:hypothetical protein